MIVNIIALTSEEIDLRLVNMPRIVFLTFAGSICILTGVSLFPVSFLMTIHFQNFCLNSTTNERFSKSKTHSDEDTRASTASYINPDQSKCKNFAEMCCNSSTIRRDPNVKRKKEASEVSFVEIIKDYDNKYGESNKAPLIG